MSRYTVVSGPDVENELALIWRDEIDRDKVSAASDAADQLLADDPLHASTHLSEQLRRRDFPPLRFFYVIREDDRLVEITNVKRLTD